MSRKRRGEALADAVTSVDVTAIADPSEEQQSTDTASGPSCSTLNCPRPTTFRPLVQDFLCDRCYVDKFPATAMVEAAGDDLDDDESKGNGNLMSSLRNQFASARMVASDAIADMQKRRAEEEERECHMCLDPGDLRRCCGKYYCHHCYFIRNGPSCPGCAASTHTTGIGRRSNEIPSDPGRWAVGITYVLTALVALTIIAGAAASFVNWTMAPATLYGRHCRGWMPRCELDVCVDASAVEDDSAFSVPIDYQPCSMSSTTSKIVSKACAFDQELYDRTGGVDGYDLCLPMSRELFGDASTGSSSAGFELSPFFNGTTIVFDDDFDRWNGAHLDDGVRLASAKWATDLPMHALVSDVCGASNTSRPYKFVDGDEFPSIPRALSFTGIHHRSASTADLSVPLGGHVEFSLIMGPLRYDPNVPASTCKPAYDGNLLLDFSIDGGRTWDTIAIYTPYNYRGYDYSSVRQVIPPPAWTNTTRFRWTQPTFDPLGEYVAIDDVRIIANSLHDGWQTSEKYLQAKTLWNDSTRSQQCCLDTEQCNAAMAPMSCPLNGEFGFARGRGIAAWHTAEALVFIAAVIVVIKTIYGLIAARLAAYEKPLDTQIANRMSRVIPAGNPVSLEKPFPVKSFNLARQSWWQFLNVGLLVFPTLALLSFDFYSLNLQGFSGRSVIFVTIATLLDSYTTAQLLTHVFQVPLNCRFGRRYQSPQQVIVSMDPETGYMKHGQHRIPLLDLLDIQVLSTAYVWVLYLLTLMSGMPFALTCYSSRFLRRGLAGHRIFSRTMGACAILRAVMGEVFLVELLLAFEWIFTFSRLKREEMGRTLRRRGVVILATYVALASTILSLLFCKMNQDGLKDSHARLIVWIGACGGILIGLMTAMLRGLPTLPRLIFTSTPVGVGHAVIYERRVRCPCVYTCASCNDIHMRQVLFLAYLENDADLQFVRMLRGENDLLASGRR